MEGTASPSFMSPPLDEVILGVQFATPEGFNSTFNGEVYGLFKDDYPFLSEYPPLAPQIEAYGGNPTPGFQIDFGEAPAKSRLWFTSQDHSHLVQFQDDRLIFNWQNRSSQRPYPRHTAMANVFVQHLSKLDQFYRGGLNTALAITQAEAAYVNIIPLSHPGAIGEWLKLVNTDGLEIEGGNATFGRVLYSDKQPVARIYYEVQMVFHSQTKQPAARFALTCRGKPENETIESARKFITYARNVVVSDFCKLTTNQAQRMWGRQS